MILSVKVTLFGGGWLQLEHKQNVCTKTSRDMKACSLGRVDLDLMSHDQEVEDCKPTPEVRFTVGLLLNCFSFLFVVVECSKALFGD